MAASPQSRRERAVSLYLEGHRAADIARNLGVSRERVRQILTESRVAVRTAAQQREQDYQLAVSGRAGEIETTFWDARDFDEVARRLDLDRRHVERVLEDLWPDIGIFEETDWGGNQQFTDDELIGALEKAAAEPGTPTPMTVEDYDAWVGSGGDDEHRPARVTIMARFAGWRPALIRAGLPANEPRRGRASP